MSKQIAVKDHDIDETVKRDETLLSFIPQGYTINATHGYYWAKPPDEI